MSDAEACAGSATAPPVADAGRRLYLYCAASLILFLPAFVWFYWPAGGGLDVSGYPIGRDFINVWSGPRLAFAGKLSTLFDPEAYHVAIGALFGHALPFHNWSYPPFALAAFWPLAQLPYFAALAVWTCAGFAAYAAVVLSQVAAPQRSRALLGLIAAPACLINAVAGQNGFLSAALLLGGMLWLDRRPVTAGMLLGLLAFKPQLGLAVPFVLLALRAWRAFAAATMTVCGLVALSVAMFGLVAWQQYLQVTGHYQVLLLEEFRGFYTAMMPSVFAGARSFGLSYPAAMAIQIVVALAVVAATCLTARRSEDPCIRALTLATAAPLVTPYVFNYDLTPIAAALVWMLSGRLFWRTEWSAVWLVGWLMPLLVLVLNPLGLGLAPVVLAVLFWVSMRAAGESPGATEGGDARPRAALALLRPAALG
jgi:Glycosyltransferase family 87